jgi:cytochrome P450
METASMTPTEETMPEPTTLSMCRQDTFEPPPELRRLLDNGRPLHPLRFPGDEVGWLVTGHEEARAVLNDPRFVLREMRPLLTVDPARQEAVIEMMQETGLLAGEMLAMDPPEHTRLRRALAPRFSIRSIGELTGPVEAIVVDLLDRMEASGPPVDLVEAFAGPVAKRSHCALLGIPEDDVPMLEMVSETNYSDLDGAGVIAVTEKFRSYIEQVVARKRAEPGDDLMTHIVETGELTEDEILGVLLLLFTAGVDTTKAMIATGAFALFRHEDQLELLRADPTLLDAAVEELMRYLTVFNVGALTRTATEDVELGGVVIGAGEQVSVSLLGADRDGGRFACPDRLDLVRGGRGHVGFGHGVHVCLGQHLARLEMRTAFALLLERFPDLRLAVPTDEVPVSGDLSPTFTVERLPVAW